MVYRIVCALFPSIFLLRYLHDLKLIPRAVTWVPEVLSLIAAAVILVRLAVYKRFSMDLKYVYLIGLYLLIVAMGILLNPISKVELVAGLRVHLKWLPFFILPAVYDFSEREFRSLLKIGLFLLLIQVPLGVAQKIYWHVFWGFSSGDFVMGTGLFSGGLSVVLISGIAIIFSLYLKKFISRNLCYFLCFFLFIPTALNETKITVIFLPLAILMPLLLIEGREYANKTKNLLTGFFLLALFGAVFVPLYDITIKDTGEPGLVDAFLDQNYLTKYLYGGVRGGIGEMQGSVRRGDAVVLAFRELSKEPEKLVLGLGVGQVTQSIFDSGQGTVGSVLGKRAHYGAEMLLFTQLFWEVGAAGLLVYLLLIFFVFMDALFLRRSDGLFGAFSLGWVVVAAFIGMTVVYQNNLHHNAINFSFWFFSGVVAANAYKFRSLCFEHRVLAERRSLYRRGLFGTAGRPVSLRGGREA